MILGTDISYYQGDVDFNKMKAAGAKYVICRKQVGYYGDSRFFEYMQGAKAAGLAFGAYGALIPGYSVTRQYGKFFEGLQPGDLDFPPIADIERRNSLGKAKNIADALEYLYALKNWWGDALIYTAKFVWEEMYSTKKGWINDWNLWVANYTTYHQPVYIPVGWEYRLDGSAVSVDNSFICWQWSADGNNKGHEFGVSSRDIDLDFMQEPFYNKYVGTPPNTVHKVALDIPKEADSIEVTLRRV